MVKKKHDESQVYFLVLLMVLLIICMNELFKYKVLNEKCKIISILHD